MGTVHATRRSELPVVYILTKKNRTSCENLYPPLPSVLKAVEAEAATRIRSYVADPSTTSSPA